MQTKILIDVTSLTNQLNYRGIGNYTISLLHYLLKDTQITWQLMAPGTKEELIAKLKLSQIEVPTNFSFFSLGKDKYKLEVISMALYNSIFYQRLINKANPDLFLALQPDRGIAKNYPSLVVIHDLIPYKSGVYSQKNQLVNGLKKANYNWALQGNKNAAGIIADSEYVKSDLIKLGFSESKITVIPLAVSKRFSESVNESNLIDESSFKRRTLNIYNITEPYILYIGGLENNKNVPQVLKSFAQVVNKYPDLKLIIGGSEFKLGWDHKALPLNERAAKICNLAIDLKIQHKVIFTGFIDSKHLPLIYKYASAFIHLSKEEGFGLAVLEPQLVGTPVIAANSSTYPEVLGSSALLVDPDNTTEIAQAISELVGRDEETIELRNKLIVAGKKNVARYSWEKNAAQLLEVIKLTLQNVKRIAETKKNGGITLVPTTNSNLEKQSRAYDTSISQDLPINKTDKITGIIGVGKIIENLTPANAEPLSVDNIEPNNLTNGKGNENKTKSSLSVETNLISKLVPKKAVLLAAYFYPFIGGMEKVALDYAKFLVSLGYEVTVITSDRKDGRVVVLKEEDYPLDDHNKFKIIRLRRRGKNYYFYRLELIYRTILNISPDLIHISGFGFLISHDQAILRYKRIKPSVKIFATPHGPFMSKPEKGLRSLFKTLVNFIQSKYLNSLIDLVIAENPEQYLWLKEIYLIPQKKIELIPPAINTNRRPLTELHTTKRRKDHILISSISRLTDYKGFNDIIAAFAEINSTIPTKLIIAGAQGDYQTELTKLIANSRRHDDISLEVDVSTQRRDEILASTDIFVFASEWEAFGLVIGEAMSQACAILSSNTEGGRYLVKPGQNGYLFPYQDLKTLVAELDKLIADKEKLWRFQDNSYLEITAYTEPQVFEKFKKVITNLMQ